MNSFTFFKKGFKLANNNLHLLGIGFVLSLLYSQEQLFTYPGIGLISFISVLLYFGYHLSIPLFLDMREKKKDLSFSNIVKTSLSNMKRSILPFIVLIFFAGIMLVLYSVIAFLSSGNGDLEAFLTEGNLFQGNQLLALLFYALSSFFIFSSIYFSIEKFGLFRSIIKSIQFSFRHLSFIMFVGLLYCISYLLSSTVYDSISKPMNILLQIGIVEYIELILISSAYYCYFQGDKVLRKK
ncbi:MAG: hypothetical protein O3B87_01270 [bacterium]|nr:hypothetical protein [bacterium]